MPIYRINAEDLLVFDGKLCVYEVHAPFPLKSPTRTGRVFLLLRDVAIEEARHARKTFQSKSRTVQIECCIDKSATECASTKSVAIQFIDSLFLPTPICAT